MNPMLVRTYTLIHKKPRCLILLISTPIRLFNIDCYCKDVFYNTVFILNSHLNFLLHVSIIIVIIIIIIIRSFGVLI